MQALASFEQHNIEIQENRSLWSRKQVLRKIYAQFHRQILQLRKIDRDHPTVEIGSGLGQIKNVIPDCVTTDALPNPWLDRVENAYQLSFEDNSVGNLILFDVWHHLRYPGTALAEFRRVLVPGGRLIVFEPCMSLLGVVIYGLLHHEPLGWREPISWFAPPEQTACDATYYAAASNAWRTFCRARSSCLAGWRLLRKQRMAALSYVASGGFRGPQLYPFILLPLVQWIDRLLDWLPSLFATRLLVVLEKAEDFYPGSKGIANDF